MRGGRKEERKKERKKDVYCICREASRGICSVETVVLYNGAKFDLGDGSIPFV